MSILETQAGDPIVAGGVRLVPIARSLRLRLGPFMVVWNRAIGVLVRSAAGGPSGTETLVPVRDRTRRLQLAILGAGLLGALLLGIGARRANGRRRS